MIATTGTIERFMRMVNVPHLLLDLVVRRTQPLTTTANLNEGVPETEQEGHSRKERPPRFAGRCPTVGVDTVGGVIRDKQGGFLFKELVSGC